MYKVYLIEKIENVPESSVASGFLMLPEERRRRVMHYRQAIDRKNCIVSYLMLKIALKECFQIGEFTLSFGEAGKPYLAEYPKVYFNISHCRYGCAVAVAEKPIGIDIQDIRPFSWKIAEKVCCKKEMEFLRRSMDKDREFTRMWAIKESCVKMSGEGILADLTRINTLTEKFVEVINREKTVISVCINDKV